MHPPSGRWLRDSWFPFSSVGWRDDAASPALLAFHGVSCPLLYWKKETGSIIFAKLNIYEEIGRNRRLKETSWGGSKEIWEKKGGSTGKSLRFFALPTPFQVCIL
jgi:hypothetical protein